LLLIRNMFAEPTHAYHKASNAFAVLGLSGDASWAEVREAYRKLAQQYHPDKVAHLAPEFQELANRRMTEINCAYTELEQNLANRRN
jgi:DnaJ-class molecular chaperone